MNKNMDPSFRPGVFNLIRCSTETNNLKIILLLQIFFLKLVFSLYFNTKGEISYPLPGDEPTL